MRVFEVLPNDDSPYKYCLDAAHRWGVPGVSCEVCGWEGKVVAAAYPGLDMPRGVDPRPYEDMWPTAPTRVRELVEWLRPHLPEGSPLGAGTEFGPLVGTGHGRFGDFTWVNPWTPLISEEALGKLRAVGITGLQVVKPEITVGGKRRFQHLELDLQPLVQRAPASMAPEPSARCGTCGALTCLATSAVDEDLIVSGDSFPRALHLVRLFQAPAYILCSKQFRDAVQTLALTDVLFREVQVMP